MNLLFTEHPYWVLILLRVALVYSVGNEAESLANISDNRANISDNNTSTVPSSIPSSRLATNTSPFAENILRKLSSTTPTPPSADNDRISSASTVGKSLSNAADLSSLQSETRSARIMVSRLNANKTSDTTDFARNTVPIKELQTPTEPTVKKTEPQRKITRKPTTDLKNKIKGVDRLRYGGGGPPPGPDASMLAYNAFTSPVEATTERNKFKKPFTTKSRPPPLSYLTSSSSIDSPLPPTAWALTTLKGSAPASEHVKNTIPASATASEQLKPLRSRTTLSALKPINSFWSTRLASKSPLTATVSSYETSGSTELPPVEEKTQAVPLNTTTESTSTVIDSKSDDNRLNKITDEKTPSTPELNAADTVNNTIILGNSVSKDDAPIKETVAKTIIQKEAPQNVEEKTLVTAAKKPDTQKTTSNEIEFQKDDIPAQNTNNITSIKLQPFEESINEAIKTADEENKLSKKNLEKNYLKKPLIYENKNLINKNLDNTSTTENNIVLTEKPSTVEETVKEVTTENVNKSGVSENSVLLTVKEVTTENVNKSGVSGNSVLTVKEVTTENVNKSAVSENSVLTMKDVTTDNLNKSAVSENSVLTMKDVTTDNVNKSAVNENTVLLTEKPSTIAEETVKEVTTDNIINKTAVSENTIISKSLTNEFDHIVTNIENDNNYNTAIYPFHNIINATKFTNKYFLENKENLNDSIMDLKIVSYNNNNNNNDSELNSIKSSSAVIIDNRTDMKEIDQSTTSMTRATNATLAPVNNNSTTEASVVTISSANKAEEQIMTTTSKDELLTTGFAENTDTTTDMPEIIATTVYMPEMNERMDSLLQTVNMTAENLNITNLNDTDLTAEIAENLDDTDNKVINISTTNFDNYLKRTNFTKFSENPLITTEASIKMKNESILKISEPNAVLNQTNNDIKNGVESELTVPANSSTVRSNFLKTTTEKQQLTTFEITDEGTVTETYNSTDENSKQHETVSNSYDIVESTISPTILHEADDINDDDSLLMYNTTGNDTKFAIDSKLNITDHDLDDDNDESIINTDDKDFTDLIVPPAVDSDSNRTSLKDDLITTTVVTGDLIKTTTEIVPKTDTAAPPVVSSTTTTSTTTPSSTTATVVTTTIASLDDDVVTPGDDDSTGIEMEDYDTGVIMPMNVRMFVHATYKEMCSSKDILIDAIVRFFQTIADRSINRNQIKIKNLMHECESPHPEDKGVVPVHLMITDNHGQYDKRLTDVFVLLVRQESLSFKYPITQVDKIIDHGMSLESETQGRGTIIAAIVISSIAGLCLLVLTILLVIMRKRQRGFNYGQRCTPVSLDDYSLDNISVYNSVRRKAMRASKRSYGNPAFDDPTAISNSLNFAGLAAAVNEKNKLEDEYSRIPVVTVKPDELPAGAEVKNRYANVIPLPETRVTLNTPNNNDFDQFINANFVKGTKGIEKFYIACQAPMKDTITDFWQMVWEQQSRIIIMLTDLHENGVEKCADYLPPSEVLDCHRVFGDLQVTLKKREAREKYIISSLQLKNLESNLWREVTHMWYIGWPVRGVPDDLSSIIAFLIEARSYAKNGPPPPIVVHCSPGTGRTGTIIAVDIAIRDFETNRVVDIPRTVYNVRRDRAGAVQTSQQYMFIYQVLHLYATKLTGGGLDSI